MAAATVLLLPLVESRVPVRYHTRLTSTAPRRSSTLRLCALASGSKGNAVFVGSGGRGVLVDAGLSGRRLAERMEAVGLEPESVSAVVVTHEHRDHIGGVGVWGRRYGVPVFMTPACVRGAEAALGSRGLHGVEVREFETGQPFIAGGMEFLPIATSHDVAESVGFRITDGIGVVGFATDLGFVSHLVRATLKDSHLLYIESNHDEDRLLNGPYPWFLKQRIRSRHGHLSNPECAALVGELLHGGLRAVVLGHLSETNNEPHLAYAATRRCLDRCGAVEDVTLLVARQDRPGRVVEIAG